ncbi:flavin reductase family protein [Streptomyces sp. NPDC029554]|uniref:flavin reductase family protein n=1 Tax=Streptomyces sp. NPDC029554 TaxID=3155126 RepID=UPI0033C13783
MSSQTEQVPTPAPPLPVHKSQWRRVLGQYPTGVTIITSVDESGAPVGMVVGTFTSVSQDPPLVGFLPQTNSKTFAKIQKTGRFRASVLGAGHENLCREFFSAPVAERFSDEGWEYDEHGIPRLSDAVAWFDATVDSVLPAGDHVMVLGAVDDLGLGPRTSGMPLLFLNGGYGSFTIPRLEFSLDDLGGRLRLATSLGDVVQRLSRELELECSLATVIRDEVVVLTAADIRSPWVGMCFPFAAPMAPEFVAWGTEEVRHTWVENARQLIGTVDADLIAGTISLVRESGYALSYGRTMSEKFDAMIASAQGDRAVLVPFWESMAAEYAEYRNHPHPEHHATVLQVPVFDSDSLAAFDVVVSGFGPGTDVDRFREIVSTTLKYSRDLTRMIGGTPPADYEPKLP